MITEDILEWVSTLPKWQQKLGYLIIEKKQITEDVLKEIYDIFKIEMKLEDGIIPDDITHSCNIDADTPPAVIWKGVGNLHGVNKLKSGSELKVSEGLTIVYGENGSGKSGYTRLLNNAFVSRGDQEILPNIFLDKPENVSANFTFCIDGNLVEYKYPESKGEYPFKTIRNFDSKSASDDMNRESKIDFAPSELTFFDLLLSACSEIQKKLDDERMAKKTDNPTLKYFPNEGKALTKMMGLSASTKVDEIIENFSVTEKEKERYEQVKTERANLVALDINRQISLINQVIDFLNKAEKKYELFEKVVSDENIDIYNQQIILLKKSKLVHDRDGMSLFENDDIEQVGTAEWKEFISAAKKYYDEINKHDKCPLCGHEINEKDLIFKYWRYLESDAENNYNVAKEAVRISKNGLSELDLSFLVESSVQEQWLLENFKTETESISTIFKEADSVRNQLFDSLENEKEVNEKCAITKPDIQGLIVKINEKRTA